LGASAQLFELQKSAFMEKKKIYGRRTQLGDSKSNSPVKSTTFKMRNYEEITPRMQQNNSYSDIGDEATPKDYAEFT
jgi:hypothetical protein